MLKGREGIRERIDKGTYSPLSKVGVGPDHTFFAKI
jgi:ribosomal protein L27